MTSTDSTKSKSTIVQRSNLLDNKDHLCIDNIKILIYGYIRHSLASKTKLNSHSVFLFTQPFNDIIFLYFYCEPRDAWDPKCIAPWMKIVDEQTEDTEIDNSEVNESGPMIILIRYGAGSAYLTNVVDSGKHVWKFRIEGTARGWWYFIGVWKVGSGEMLVDKWFNSNTADNSYTFSANCACLPDPSSPNQGGMAYSKLEKYYGTVCKKGDIVEMHLDLYERTLAYSINGKYYGIAYENIEQTKYRAAVGLAYTQDSIRLLSYVPS